MGFNECLYLRLEIQLTANEDFVFGVLTVWKYVLPGPHCVVVQLLRSEQHEIQEMNVNMTIQILTSHNAKQTHLVQIFKT